MKSCAMPQPRMYPPANSPYNSWFRHPGPMPPNNRLMNPHFGPRTPLPHGGMWMNPPRYRSSNGFSSPYANTRHSSPYPRPRHVPREETADRLAASPSRAVTSRAPPDQDGVQQFSILRNPAKEDAERKTIVQAADVDQPDSDERTSSPSVSPVEPISGVTEASDGSLGSTSSVSDHTTSLVVGKGKTPMCIVNELARFNKIQHQYHLTDETGPAHKKTFTVTLRLGNKPSDGGKDESEEYVAQGASIKRAQHAAALMALEKTKFRKPEPKLDRKPSQLAPTVELNTLAMKMGESLEFRVRHPPPMYLRFPMRPLHSPVLVTLVVGNREFSGSGATLQGAKHNAASKALGEFRERYAAACTKENEKPAESDAVEKSMQSFPGKECVQEIDEILDLKSPISLLHEAAVRHDLNVDFVVVRESGPPHLRTFVTRCTVSSAPEPSSDPKPQKSLVLAESLSAEAEGNGKKVSKKKAAELVLKKLTELHTELVQEACKKEVEAKTKKLDVKSQKPQSKKKKIKIIKEQAGTVDYGDGINPISRLIQIQQAKKEKEPVYTLLQEKGASRKREFTVQATCGEFKCEGVGNNKKMAKRAAADALLSAMGYAKPMPVPEKPAIKQTSSGNADASTPEGAEGATAASGVDVVVVADNPVEKKQKGRKVTFDPNAKESNDDAPRGAAALASAARGRQLAPGLLQFMTPSPVLTKPAPPPPKTPSPPPNKTETTQDIASPPCQARRTKTELTYLSSIMGFAVNFTDIPKRIGDVQEYVSLVTFPTWIGSAGDGGGVMPDGVFHGVGSTVEEAQENAARQALDALTRTGLSAVLNKDD